MIGKYFDGALALAMGAALLVVLTVVGWMSYQAGAASGARAAAAERERTLQAEQAATREALERLQAAQTRGDTLSRQLAATIRETGRLRKERDDAISRTTTGRVCLDEPALRVLDGAPGPRCRFARRRRRRCSSGCRTRCHRYPRRPLGARCRRAVRRVPAPARCVDRLA